MHNMPVSIGVIGEIDESVNSSDIRVFSNLLLHMDEKSFKDAWFDFKREPIIQNLFQLDIS